MAVPLVTMAVIVAMMIVVIMGSMAAVMPMLLMRVSVAAVLMVLMPAIRTVHMGGRLGLAVVVDLPGVAFAVAVIMAVVLMGVIVAAVRAMHMRRGCRLDWDLDGMSALRFMSMLVLVLVTMVVSAVRAVHMHRLAAAVLVYARAARA